VTVEPAGRHEPEVFKEEIRTAVRYERGLVIKALAVLVVVAVIVVLRTLYFALPMFRATDDSRGGDMPVTRRRGMGRSSTVAAVVAVALAAAAFAVALIAAADSRSTSRDLASRLVPAAAAANDLSRLYTGQQTALRVAVTSGDVSGLQSFNGLGAAFRVSQDQIASLARADQSMTARLDATITAYRAWLARVADPQAADLSRGDVAAARALQANLRLVSPRTLAVRSAGLSLQSEITSEQQQVTDSLGRIYNTLLGALVVMVVVVAAAAAGVIVTVRRGLLRPFRQLSAAVAAVAEGGYSTRVPAVGDAELADLSRGVERMRISLVAALAERERAEENVRNLFDLAPDAMVAVDSGGIITMANAQAVQAYGYSAHEFIGRPVKTLLPEEWRASLPSVGDRRSQPVGQELESAGLRRDGSTFPAEVRLSLLPTEHGTVTVAAVRDVSERLAMEAERERLRAVAEQERFKGRLQQSQRLESLGQLVGGVAHDFNNLLNVIAGYTDFTKEQLTALVGEDDRLQPVLADVEQVAAAAQQAIRVTRQLLTFSRSEAVKREILDMNQMVESSGELLRRALGEHIDLVISCEPGLWRVEADRGQLEQVLVNVALNARDAMPGGGRLTIETGNAEVDDAYASQRPRLEPGRYCRLAVSDTGTGMDQATIERVFEPFFSTKPRGRGTGLGLATVYGIVTGVGGSIDIYSEQGLGTTVNVLLPATRQSAAAEATPDLAAAELRGQGETILLVEDEDGLRAMASRLLTRNGYRVCEAEDGADAVRLAANPALPIELLVTDMVMPGMLGNEVIDQVQAIRPGLRALYITGYAQQVLDFHGIPARDFDILQKPFTEVALLTRVHRALNRPAAPIGSAPDDDRSVG
jgi:PAS domain S-box-containing protein